MTVEHLLCTISSRELSEWHAYHMVLADEEREREMQRQAVAGLNKTKQARRR